MGEDPGTAQRHPTAFSPFALRALANTRIWALLAGFALLAECLLGLVRGAAQLAHAPTTGGGPYHSGRVAGLVAASLIVAALDAALAWYALRYGRRLRDASGGDPAALTAALRAQHAYWRLQAIVIIVLITLAVIGILLMVAALALAQH